MAGFLVRIITNALGLYIAFLLVPGFVINGGLREYLLAGLALALLNILVRPILKLISLPLILITLGLFTIVINAIMLWLVDHYFGFMAIHTTTALFLGTLVIAAVNLVATHSRENKK